jgi:hypothetical protein
MEGPWGISCGWTSYMQAGAYTRPLFGSTDALLLGQGYLEGVSGIFMAGVEGC